ncbi:MAG TPA: phosphotransferase, partial [Ilumatobacteraceae bacterium]
MAPDDVTAQWLGRVFGARVEVTGRERIGDGLVGMNIRVGLQSPDPSVPGSVVVKLPSPDPTSRAAGVALRNYEREVKFYNEIAGSVDIHVPRCFHAEWDPADHEFVIVLEDLAPAAPGDQVAGCSIATARAAVLELARLHGPRWDDPTLADVDWLNRRTGPQDGQMLGAMWAMVLPAFNATYAPYLSADASALVDRFGGRIVEWVDGRNGPWTVTHGDYRLDNLMFATPAGGAPITTVDWQSPGHGPAMSDVSYFLGAGPLSADRAAIERDLVGEYAAALRADYQVEIDDGWAWEQYRREAFAGVVMAVIASQLVGG